MPRQAATGSEFWRDRQPIDKVFQTDAKPDVYVQDAPTDDESYYVPLTETVHPAALDIARPRPLVRWPRRRAGQRHYHPHEVFAYTISGEWGYLEHDWVVATAGDFVYETPGEAHMLVAHDHSEPMKVHLTSGDF